MAFELYKLTYPEKGLEPYICAQTIEFHYGKHHTTYLKNINDLIAGTPFETMTLEEIIVATQGDETKKAIYNNAAQVYNHTFYWQSLTPNGGAIQEGDFKNQIIADFGSVDNMIAEFKKAAISQFGSGWAWLIKENNHLKIISTPNAVTPTGIQRPILTLDVWEHAYYLDYQNRRGDYADDVLKNLLNWSFVSQNFHLI